MRFATVRDLKNRTSEMLRMAASGKPVLITSHGKPVAVLQGMTQDEIDRAIQPFTQIRSAYTRNEEGTGLGLPIARALVLRHGGTFHVASTPTVGTTVTFTLPIATETKIA